MKIIMNRGKIYHTASVFLILLLMAFLSGCGHTANIPGDSLNADTITPAITVTATPAPITTAPTEEATPSEPVPYDYINETELTLEGRINPPSGYSRSEAASSSLLSFIRKLPLKTSGSDVLLYNGQPKANQSDHVAVFDLKLSDRDLQQCADSAIRVYAEYYWSIGAYEKIAFHLTNGFYMEYTKWRDGNRLRVDGNEVSWYQKAAYDNSHEEFLNYLDMVFAYAGTLSLASECNSISVEELLPGDLFLQGGSPGHCVLVVDMAVDSQGNTCYLLAQGYMPAQEFHVLKNPLHPEDPWYYASEIRFPFDTPAWRFEEGSLVRWRDFSEQASSSVTLLAVGDNLIHREVVASGKKEDGTYQYDHLYSNLKEEISSADIAVVNQETIFGGKASGYSGYPRFNSPTEIGDALINTGFDVILQATNHTLDMGVKGLENAFDYWKTKPSVTVLGINETEEMSHKVTIVEKNGIKIAMLNYTFSLNGNTLPKGKGYLVNLLKKDKIKQDLNLAKEEADFTIVFPHWGTEYVYKPIAMQKELTDFFYENGVDLVIGAHPHVIEPVEWIEKEEGHRMLVYYSLGNFLSYQREAPRMLGAMAGITIVKDNSGTYISDADITPIVTHYENGPADYHYAIYKLSDYTPELAKIHGVSDIATEGPMDYQETVDLAKTVLGSWYPVD